MSLDPALRDRISKLVTDNRVMLFMKGSRSMPQCGFSAAVVQILDQLVPGQYQTENVLADPELREGIKAFSNWPTIPQLYVGGEFIGGCDIVREMFASGELQAALGVEAAAAPPAVKRMSVQELKAKLDAGEPLHLYDVRTPREREIAVIPGARLFDQAAQHEIAALPKDAALVFHCHHGPRSQQAAQYFAQQGFRNVYNVPGGIDAWSQLVDPSVRRY